MGGSVLNSQEFIVKGLKLGAIAWMLINLMSLILYALAWLAGGAGTAMTISAMATILASQTLSAPWFDFVYVGGEGVGITMMYISLSLLINSMILAVLYSAIAGKIKPST